MEITLIVTELGALAKTWRFRNIAKALVIVEFAAKLANGGDTRKLDDLIAAGETISKQISPGNWEGKLYRLAAPLARDAIALGVPRVVVRGDGHVEPEQPRRRVVDPDFESLCRHEPAVEDVPPFTVS
jgi:hypothetical protein